MLGKLSGRSVTCVPACVGAAALMTGSMQRLMSSQVANSEGDKEKKERIYFKEQDMIQGFPVFDVYMKKQRRTFEKRKPFERSEISEDATSRFNFMSVDQDWTNVWPTAAMFRASAVPLPVRQGAIRNNTENGGLPPGKLGNTELMKIPNFLHLTPLHIKKHCAAIKRFCTEWPKELRVITKRTPVNEHGRLLTADKLESLYPLEITTSNYIYDGPSLRDDRARTVTMSIDVNNLQLDKASRHKLITLAQHRYDPKSGRLTITSSRCPYRRQNIDYLDYLLTTLYYESKQRDEWEAEMTEEDRSKFEWNLSRSRANTQKWCDAIRKQGRQTKKHLDMITSDYSRSVTTLFNEGESVDKLRSFKQSTLQLLGLQSNDNNNTNTTNKTTTTTTTTTTANNHNDTNAASSLS